MIHADFYNVEEEFFNQIYMTIFHLNLFYKINVKKVLNSIKNRFFLVKKMRNYGNTAASVNSKIYSLAPLKEFTPSMRTRCLSYEVSFAALATKIVSVSVSAWWQHTNDVWISNPTEINFSSLSCTFQTDIKFVN